MHGQVGGAHIGLHQAFGMSSQGDCVLRLEPDELREIFLPSVAGVGTDKSTKDNYVGVQPDFSSLINYSDQSADQKKIQRTTNTVHCFNYIAQTIRCAERFRKVWLDFLNGPGGLAIQKVNPSVYQALCT